MCDHIDSRVPAPVCSAAGRLTRSQAALQQLLWTLPDTNDWLTAVRIAQRAYPGTDWWLISCSASEGGHGPWVPNRGGSGASGWMQFLSGTFNRMWKAAKDDVTARGFRLPPGADDWYSPLAQALAGAWGYENGRRGEWYGHGC